MTENKTRSRKPPPGKRPPEEALETSVQFCPGVGPKRAMLLEKLGIKTLRDLLWHLPRAYEDFHTLTPIRALRPGMTATVLGTILDMEDRRLRSWSKVKTLFRVRLEDQTGAMFAVWFNQPFLADRIRRGVHLLLHGKVEIYDQFLQMSSPKFQIIGAETVDTSGIMPLYPLTEGLTQAILRKVIGSALERFGRFCEEFLPEDVLQLRRFPVRIESFRALHAPRAGEGAPTDISVPEESLLFDPSREETSTAPPALCSSEPESLWERARKRLVFEEFFLHQYILARYRGKIKREPGICHTPPESDPFAVGETFAGAPDGSNAKTWPSVFIKNLPFQLTPDQVKVCREIQNDLCSPTPMNRLLQGDVGSGKTVVSLYAAVVAAAGGYQAALMTPTEILAQQHASVIRGLTASLPGLTTVVLTGSLKAADSREVREAISSGAARIVVGTHALFQEQVAFANLGLVLVDEQHKFGVNQRQRLVEKGAYPDLLVATATPIPRTLSLTLYGDMDVSIIRGLPPGRPPITTRWTTWEQEDKLWRFVDEKIEQGQQAYVVCPIIEPSENVPHLPSTEEAFERLSETYLPHRRVEVLHGRHSAEVKADRMERMRSGEIDVVIATTVIEVGVDLPNATVMVVLGADRFGLAQLHQLRGRVGRGRRLSYCVLVTPSRISPPAEQRMRIMEQTRDGFVIADEDMKLRGPGEIFGVRQSGFTKFHLADLFRDGDLLRDAHEAAGRLYQEDPDLRNPEHRRLREEIRLAFGRYEFSRPS